MPSYSSFPVEVSSIRSSSKLKTKGKLVVTMADIEAATNPTLSVESTGLDASTDDIDEEVSLL